MSTPAPARELRPQVRLRLIAIAEGLVEGGLAYSAISVERLTREAGMPRTRFYSYFDDKADLLLAWFDSARSEIDGAAAKWSDLQRVNSNQQLRSVLRGLLEAHRVRRSLFAAMSESGPTDPRLQSAYEELLQTIAAGLREHIERGQRAGWVDPGLLSAGTADWLIWGWERNASMVSDWATDAEFARSLDGFTSFVWGALYRCTADTVSS